MVIQVYIAKAQLFNNSYGTEAWKSKRGLQNFFRKHAVAMKSNNNDETQWKAWFSTQPIQTVWNIGMQLVSKIFPKIWFAKFKARGNRKIAKNPGCGFGKTRGLENTNFLLLDY